MSTAIRFAATVAAVVSFGIAGPAAARRYGERHQGTRRVALRGVDRRVDGPQHARPPGQLDRLRGGLLSGRRRGSWRCDPGQVRPARIQRGLRVAPISSEERRVGKEWISKFKFRWAPE